MATRDLNGQKVSFHAHPVSQESCNYGVATDDTIRPDLSIGNKLQQRGHKFAKILEMQQSTKLSIQQDLCGRTAINPMERITQHPRDYSYTAQTLLRLKANRLSMWNMRKLICPARIPNAPKLFQSSVQHLFWECPKAKLVWNYFYALWTKIGITPGHDPRNLDLQSGIYQILQGMHGPRSRDTLSDTSSPMNISKITSIPSHTCCGDI
ncbi:hypothetical protein FI667_g2570, partial [Globisporangium splendens]